MRQQNPLFYVQKVTGFYSCTKCTIKGKYLDGRVCFPNESCSLRTDDLFAINGYKNFQTSYSIVNNIPGFLPITTFRWTTRIFFFWVSLKN